ncbi:MAG TPA: nitrate ABC transporter ATP-binding protein [Steroidobacteraceae bacterium]|nr:nitrate ABC transporter ATP-binding protein [Steroidobacteraceae bacterium]
MSFLELKNVCKSYSQDGVRLPVLRDVSLSIAEGEFVALVGYSGSGKTTLVATLAGLVAPDSGQVLFKGRPVNGADPARAVVFQNYSLMPWLTVTGNVRLAVDAVHGDRPGSARAQLVERYVKMVGLAHAEDRRPAELSGGMRQRVAVARALAMEPELLLLDEPLSALDALTRARLQDEIEAIWEQQRRTVVLVTNDVDEALLLADRVITMLPAGAGDGLGREFRVELPRPRERHSVNDHPHFKALRARITACLQALGESRAARRDAVVSLPEVTPLSATRPRALRNANKPRPAENPAKFVEFHAVDKVYPTRRGQLTVVEGFSLDIARGEFISLIGHSGCGKSTVLSMVAGLTENSGGAIVLDGREVHTAGPDRGVVFQAPNLLPWLTARQNVALGVERVFPHATAAERRDIIEYYLARVGLADAMDRGASELSNGMKQRVGLARAFALSPKLLLLDEPFGMLDALTRWELQEVLMDVWKKSRVTAICVTHDVDEAILLADRVVMMTNGPAARIGKVMSVDLPRPRNRQALLAHPRYYDYRAELLGFLEEHEHASAAAA